MNITIFERKPKKKDGNPNYIVWDMDEMKRLTCTVTYEKAIEVKKDWEELYYKITKSLEEEYKQEELPFA